MPSSVVTSHASAGGCLICVSRSDLVVVRHAYPYGKPGHRGLLTCLRSLPCLRHEPHALAGMSSAMNSLVRTRAPGEGKWKVRVKVRESGK